MFASFARVNACVGAPERRIADIWQWLIEPIDQRLDTSRGLGVRNFRVGIIIDGRVGDNYDALSDVIEYQHRIGEHEYRLGHAHAQRFAGYLRGRGVQST